MMMPITQEDTSFTVVFFCCFYKPMDEFFTVVVVYPTVAFETKVYVSETGYFLKKHVLPFLLDDWFMVGHVYLVLKLDVVEILGIQFSFLLQGLVQFC